MSLPSRISQVVFSLRDGASTISTHTIRVSSLRHPWDMVFWEGRKGLSIGGRKRSKNIIRGFDARLEFDWEDVRNQETAITNLIDDLKVATDNDYDIRFNASGSTDYLFVVPDEAVFSQDYINQIKRTPTRISFELAELQGDISYE